MYKAKTTFTGYKLGLSDPSLYVGIPSKYWRDGWVTASFDGETKDFREADVEKEEAFNDKFSSGTYSLKYVVWEKREDKKVIQNQPRLI